MGKQSKKGKNKGKVKACSRNGRPSPTSSATAPPVVAPAVSRRLPVDHKGRMAQRDGRRFHALLSALGHVVLPKFESERKHRMKEKYSPIQWVGGEGIGVLPLEERVSICDYILRNIDELSQQVDNGVYDNALRAILGRRLSTEEKATIRLWKVHIQDDFFVVDHIPNKGAVFVQVGLSQREVDNAGEDLLSPCSLTNDVHEPRVFIVRGLFDPIEEMLASSTLPKKRHTSRKIAIIRTTLLPYMDGITYMSFMTQPCFQLFKTLKDFDEAVDTAVAAAKVALADESEENVASLENVSLYYALDPKTDASISYLASDAGNEGMNLAMESNLVKPERALRDDETEIVVTQMYWNPTATRKDPLFETNLNKVRSGQRPLLLEGVKNQGAEKRFVADNDPCPFHVRYGTNNKSFACCCKRLYLKRREKATRTGRSAHCHVVYCPFGSKDVEAFPDDPRGFEREIATYLQCDYLEAVDIEITIPSSFASLVKQRIDESHLFHAVLPFKWIYLGYSSLYVSEFGLMTFGDITFDARAGVLAAQAISPKRLEHMIAEFKHFCCDLPVKLAKLITRPAYKIKPDMKSLHRNYEILQDGYENVPTELVIDKESMSSMGRHCGYCGEVDNDKLLFKCSCRAVLYCSSDCQRAHWRSHKKQCNKLRGLDVKKERT